MYVFTGENGTNVRWVSFGSVECLQDRPDPKPPRKGRRHLPSPDKISSHCQDAPRDLTVAAKLCLSPGASRGKQVQMHVTIAIYLSVYRSIYLSIYLSTSLSMHMCMHTLYASENFTLDLYLCVCIWNASQDLHQSITDTMPAPSVSASGAGMGFSNEASSNSQVLPPGLA